MINVDHQELVRTFRSEAKRQEGFTNSFWRQLAVILVSIIIINILGPKIIFWQTNIAANNNGQVNDGSIVTP